MPITLVRYSAEFSVNGLKRWISCEASVLKEGDEDKEIDGAIAFCFKTNDRVHGWQQPIQSPEPAILPTTIVEKEPETRSLIDDIKSCQEITVLEAYRLIVRNKPDLQAAYDETFAMLESMERLTNNKESNGKRTGNRKG